ncbi:MAG: tRNA pseudouridine(55) synthase TruB [Clostridia bacterium]|nr:tRNA pseudouridine(55) synthase TruB [Clostridia bacterium]
MKEEIRGSAPCGIFLLDKGEGMTSHTAVSRAARLFGVRQAGHTGTLDPNATGLLVVLVGRAVKAAALFPDGEKRYEACLRLGLTSDTEDIWGTLSPRTEPLPSFEEIARTAKERFTGRILQTPPMVSALKRDGQKLCDLARRGIAVEREPREITVNALTVSPTEREDEYALSVVCSKGTYIRTLCADLGEALGCGAVMSALRRTGTCGFTLEGGAMTLDELEKTPPEDRAALLRPVDAAFPSFPAALLPPFYARLAQSGCEIYQQKIGTSFPAGERVRFYDESGFFAFAEAREYPDGSALKPIRLMRL